MRKVSEIIGNTFMYILTIVQTKELFQIISLVLSIVISLIIIIEKVITWYKNANKDGKITNDEIKELSDLTNKDIKEISENIEDLVDVIQNEEEK